MLITDNEYVTAVGQTELPVYQLHYAIYYNSSAAVASPTPGPVQVVVDELKTSNVCARHYAETFLIRLFHLQSWLNEQCSTQRSFAPRVIVHTIVVVRVYGSLVSAVLAL